MPSLNGRHFLPEKASSGQTETEWKENRRRCSSSKQSAARVHARAQRDPSRGSGPLEPSPAEPAALPHQPQTGVYQRPPPSRRPQMMFKFREKLKVRSEPPALSEQDLSPSVARAPSLCADGLLFGKLTQGQISVPYFFASKIMLFLPLEQSGVKMRKTWGLCCLMVSTLLKVFKNMSTPFETLCGTLEGKTSALRTLTYNL